uniref:CHRD chordin domain protein n=1 Tax=Pithovirus LCPAC404 TaxID=2506597 RepID=A0A481ZCU5_9VIRU|nr:MAG: CHRD chordin domain protein [Pithovirus LCPAC404]
MTGRKWLQIIIIVIVVLLIVWWLYSLGCKFVATINGSQVVPPIDTYASGSGIFQLSSNQSSLNYDITTQGLVLSQITGAFVQRGAVGNNGPIVKVLDRQGINMRGNWTSDEIQPLTPELVDDLENELLYVNITTVGFPNGQIRGQLFRV